MPVTVHLATLDDVLWLINEFGTVPRAAAEEQAAPYPTADDAARRLKLHPTAVTATDLVATADHLYAALSAPAARTRAAAVNAHLAAARPAPQLDDEATAISAWLVEARTAAEAVAAAAWLAVALDTDGGGGPARVAVCAAHRCADLYRDTHPAGIRRFCSPTCRTRAKVATHRARRRAAGAP